MEYQYIDIIKDNRVNCFSVLRKMNVREFLNYIEVAYSNRGGIEGQRAPLKTKTAMSIRKRMIEDLKKGAVLPPVVLGIIISEEIMENLDIDSESEFLKVIKNASPDEIAIIDGMQRTTGLLESIEEISKETKIRVEYWIATNMNSLIYRMLVLNTGQIPWNLRKQLEVVFDQLISKFSTRIPSMTLLKADDNNYRKEAGQYQAHEFVELFILFGTRKHKVEIQDQLAEEFAKLDLIEASSNNDFLMYFFGVADLLVKLDITFSKVTKIENENLLKFKNGKDIFKSHPARVGFVAACSRYIFGKPGIERELIRQHDKFKVLNRDVNLLIKKLENSSIEELKLFMEIEELDEIITNKKSGKVGEFEREFFLKAFEILLEENVSLNNLSPCWRALV
ncbi:hypothetical protein BHU72_13205 [Desulfuribacillus stibiiarsenatis]|uniref:DGQHR domain-containing protein n=1 Tax=Desulfuribacillus stibiiarsenatis TaxID=1390249 RepID=A0A1E5L8T7_9FIRM|nr:hypothetical protein [Desulfuribacillus stibiiarsenatis]OEH86560.1 hypothetical protein BHU72_13205 [Desulfuribacillus stibiiarsenatis]